MTIKLHNIDCLDFMRTKPDGFYDIAIADPPYGIGRDWEKRNGWRTKKAYRDCTYLNERPLPEVFDEIRRVAKEWIIWGWNYYTDILPPTNYLIVWDKMSNCNQVFHYSKCEIAATSIRIPCNIVSIGWDGYRMGEETGTKKIHPHQKPVALYRWLLKNYAKPGFTVFDPFAGSAASGVACQELGFDWEGCEIEPSFYGTAVKRLGIDPGRVRARVSKHQMEFEI